MNYYIYQIVNTLDHKFYIGMRSCNCAIEDDKYMGSGKLLHVAFKKYGKENFRKEILISNVKDKETLAKLEAQIVTQELVDDRMCYNIKPGGIGGCEKGREFSIEHRTNLSEALKGRTVSDATRIAIAEASRNRAPASITARANMSIAHTGYKHTEEAIKNMCDAQQNREPISDAARVAMSKSYIGKKASDVTRKKMSEARKAYCARKRAEMQQGVIR